MRLDALLCKEGLFPSRNKSAQAINEGGVLYRGKIAKPSLDVEDLSEVTILDRKDAFVSNGGYKLKKALDDFGYNPSGLTFADIGASNGGFTDCLLKSGAKKVYAVDVGETQLEQVLLCDSRVIVKDNQNARFLTEETLGERVDGVTVDVSFISVTYILEGIKNVLKDGAVALILIKPQFECGKEYLGNSGIVKNERARHLAIKKVYEACLNVGLFAVDITTAPIREKKNVEYVIMLKNSDKNGLLSIEDVINKIR
ncbi:MAG: TlyA family RNA methyltransferase [Clostridia bacterium]|nr:TlyA family RNA methyltransferase [Clostridia bacterium]